MTSPFICAECNGVEGARRLCLWAFLFFWIIALFGLRGHLMLGGMVRQDLERLGHGHFMPIEEEPSKGQRLFARLPWFLRMICAAFAEAGPAFPLH